MERVEPRLSSIKGVIDANKEVLIVFYAPIGIKDSNKSMGLAIEEALKFFTHSSFGSLVMESYSTNAISWELASPEDPSKFQFSLYEIKA